MTSSNSQPLAGLTRVEHPLVDDDAKRQLAPLKIVLQAVTDYLTTDQRAVIEKEFAAYLNKNSYPALVGNQMIDRLCATCLADRPLAEARQLIGRYYLLRYRESVVGKIMLAMLPMMGMERILRKSPHDFATVTNYGTRWVTEISPGRWEYHFQDEIMYPELIQGLLLAGGEVARVPDLRITFTIPKPKHLHFVITWSA